MDHAQQWKSWLDSVPEDQQKVLLDVLLSSGKDIDPRQPGPTNGHSSEVIYPESTVKIVRTKTQDAYVQAPTYVDVMGFFPIYDRIAFNTNLLLKGPKGVGKSLSYTAWAAKNQIPVVTIECSEDTKKHDLMGTPFIVGDETFFVLGGIPTAIEIANEVGRCILALEEINALTPQVQKQLNAISDFRQAVSIPHIAKVFRLREGASIWILGSSNPTVYGGTYDLNEDLRSRFEEIEVHYPEKPQEMAILKQVGAPLRQEQLDQLYLFAKETRSHQMGYALSTRDLVRMTHNVARLGMDLTLQMVLGKFEGEDKETVLHRIPSIFTGIAMPKKYWGGV